VSLLAIAWTVVAFLVGALVVVLCVVMANLFRVITSTRDLIEGVTKQTVPLLAEVGTTVSLVNQEIGRVDGILATAEAATGAVGNVVNVVSTTVTNPLVRLSAFAWGVRRAVSKATEQDEGTTGSRRRGRRRR
jgi:predicted PurR-regulated permease PerM